MNENAVEQHNTSPEPATTFRAGQSLRRLRHLHELHPLRQAPSEIESHRHSAGPENLLPLPPRLCVMTRQELESRPGGALHCHCVNLVLSRATSFRWEMHPQPARNDLTTIIEALEGVCAATGPVTAQAAAQRMLAAIGSLTVGAFYEAAVPAAGFLTEIVRCGELWASTAALLALKTLGAWAISSPPPERVRRTSDGMPLDVALLGALEDAEPVFRAAALSGATYATLAAELLMLTGTALAGKLADA